MYKVFFKSLFDFTLTLIGILLLSPLFVIVLIYLFIYNNGFPFFFQKRPGMDGKIFKIIKFKTMNDKKDSDGNLLPDSMRLTKVGNFIRKTSLDELPQLFNILKGDMSLIGPRPLLPEYLSLYSKEQQKRHLVKPGITGWAQVNGRNTISWQQKFELDVWYVNHVSFLLDIKILYRTILKVIHRSDINRSGEATTTRFKGNS